METIAAIATPPGKGGIGIIRISGPKSQHVAQVITHQTNLAPRKIHFCSFYDASDQIIDQGLALLFSAPNSFTGEDVLELHAHGSPIVLDNLLQTIINLDDVRLALPGEFSERAFLNNKIDLSQAEAIADLINASSQQAARSAIRSLQGEFAKLIHHLIESITNLRVYVEASIDFAEEEIDFLSDAKIGEQLQNILHELNQVLSTAKQGSLLREGMTVVIAGEPNAGKSTLINCLSGKEVAIVTPIAGTTRDLLREQINLAGLPLNIIDTAGLRTETTDKIEQEGIRRAYLEIENADRILLIVDDAHPTMIKKILQTYFSQLKHLPPITIIKNKIDLTQQKPQITVENDFTIISISAKYHQGIELLTEHLKQAIGFAEQTENVFIARRRHVDALERAQQYLLTAQQEIQQNNSFELVAENFRQAQQCLGEITGEVTTEDLLDKIFAGFCVGK